jgi:hypothetical protein
MQGPGFFSQKTTDFSDELNLVYELNSEEVTDADGNTFAVSAEIPEGTFSVGSLVISSALSMSGEIDLDETFSISGSEDMSASVSVSSDEGLSDAAVGSIYITIPLSGVSLALRQSTIAVAYHVTDSLGETWAGLMFKDEYQETDEGLRFALKGMGNYQIIKIPGVMTSTKTKKMTKKPRNRQQAEEAAMFEGIPSEHLLVWLDSSKSENFCNKDQSPNDCSINTWSNSFSQDYSFTGQNTVDYQDGFINFMPDNGLAASLGSSYMEANMGPQTFDNGFHYFLVMSVGDSSSIAETALVTFDSLTANKKHSLNYWDMNNADPQIKLKVNNLNPGVGETRINQDEYVILELSYDRDKISMRVNGADKGYVQVGELDLNGTVRLSDNNSVDLSLGISDFLVFDQKLSPNMRSDVYDVLSEKLNLSGM